MSMFLMREWFDGVFGMKFHTSVAAINAHFRLWGHQFLYDEDTLAVGLRNAGFGSVQRVTLGESRHPALRGLENTKRYPDGLLDFESLALEATK